MRTIYLDGDLMLHRASAAVQREYKWSADVTSVGADFHEARRVFDRQYRAIARQLGADRVVVALSDPANNWRKRVLPSYKQQRTKRDKPVLFKQLRLDVEDRYECIWRPWLEADDVLGMAATKPGAGGERVVVSWDKDLLGVPCRLFNPHHPERGVLEVSLDEADRFHLLQTLAGDPVDNYAGIPGVGPKKALLILADENPKGATPWQKVQAAYRKHGLTDHDALLMARVARILRHGEYDRDVGVKLWGPPCE